MERKVHEIKSFHETEKQEIRRQHSRMYQDLLDETNQVRFPSRSSLSTSTNAKFSV